MGSINLADPLDLGSFLLMMYSAMIALYVTRRAARVGMPLFVLPLLLSSMILLHGMHHFFAFFGNSILEQYFDFAASVSAFVLALAYTYVWRRY